MLRISLEKKFLSESELNTLEQMRIRCLERIILSTTLAGSGHPGGSMSSLHLLLLLYSTIRNDPKQPYREDRDRLVVSCGHISPGVYSVLCEFGYADEGQFLFEFRRAGGAFAGHVETCVPGVEWNTGNLGQGLSVGTGMALALKLKGYPGRVAVMMGDGEQQKGQISEARRFAAKYELGNLIAIIDRNHLQIGGSTEEIMPQEIAREYSAAHWNVLQIQDGHDFDQIFQALRKVHLRQVENPGSPTVIIVQTIMGKGVSFMENQAKYHGATLTDEEASRALEELGLENRLCLLRERKKSHHLSASSGCILNSQPALSVGTPRFYPPSTLTDNRSAYGAALEDLARINNSGGVPKVVGFTCDLEGSVKMTGFRKVCEKAFSEAGIQEHHAATAAGALSKEGFTTFLSTFGVFATCEIYNQHRLSDINETGLKVVATHVGLDVGEDGQTHQCIDYIGLMQNLYGFSIFIPADPNQTDRIIRYVASHPGNFFVGMGRSKVPVIQDEEGAAFFTDSYRFTPGKADWLREGSKGAILSYGATLQYALSAAGELLDRYQIPMSLLNFSSIKPLDRNAILCAAESGLLVSVEDHHVDTGLGARVAMVLADSGVACRLIRLGVKRYGCSGKPAELYRLEGIDTRGIVDTVLQALKSPH